MQLISQQQPYNINHSGLIYYQNYRDDMDKPFVCFNCGVIIKDGLYCDDCKGKKILFDIEEEVVE